MHHVFSKRIHLLVSKQNKKKHVHPRFCIIYTQVLLTREVD